MRKFWLSFNRTRLELKLIIQLNRLCFLCRFNRTRLELKHLSVDQTRVLQEIALIGPGWN